MRKDEDDALQLESTLNSRGQTTIPGPIRKALGLATSDRIRFTLSGDSTVTLTRAAAESESDPLVNHFLTFLERDALNHPARILAVKPTMVTHAQSVVEGVHMDLDAPLNDDD